MKGRGCDVVRGTVQNVYDVTEETTKNFIKAVFALKREFNW